MFGTVGPPPPPSPGAVVPPPSEMLGKGSEQGGGLPSPLLPVLWLRKCSGNVREIFGIGGAPLPNPSPGWWFLQKCSENVGEMLGKCSELGGGSTLIHPFPGSWFPKFSELGGGGSPIPPRDIGSQVLCSENGWEMFVVGRCPLPHPSLGGGSPENARAGMAVVLTVLADIEHVSLRHLQKAGGDLRGGWGRSHGCNRPSGLAEIRYSPQPFRLNPEALCEIDGAVMQLPGLRPCRVGLVGDPVTSELTIERAHAACRPTAAALSRRRLQPWQWLADSAAASSLTDGVAAERVQLNGGAVLAETVGALSYLSAAPGFAAAQASDSATVAEADAGQNMGRVAAEAAQTVGLPQTRAAAERNQLVSGARPRFWLGPPNVLSEEAPRLYRCSTGIFLGRRTLEGVTMLKWVIYEAVVL